MIKKKFIYEKHYLTNNNLCIIYIYIQKYNTHELCSSLFFLRLQKGTAFLRDSDD